MPISSWSATTILHGAILSVVVVTFATGMALTSSFGRDGSDPPETEPWRPYYIAHACDWTFLSLSCPLDRVINVVRAMYGRQDLNYCPHLSSISGLDWDSSCAGAVSKSRRIVSKMCSGKSTCQIPVFNGLFGDPCPNTYKYLEVYYACVEAFVVGVLN